MIVWLLLGGFGSCAVIAIAAVRAMVGRRRMSPRIWFAAAGWVWVCTIVAATFGTPSGGGRSVNLTPLDVTNPADLVDGALNIALFAPVGVLVALLGWRWGAALAIGLGGSLLIEGMQYVIGSGRTSDVNDLASNTLGCLIGFVLMRLVARRRPLRPNPGP